MTIDFRAIPENSSTPHSCHRSITNAAFLRAVTQSKIAIRQRYNQFKVTRITKLVLMRSNILRIVAEATDPIDLEGVKEGKLIVKLF